MDPQAYRTHPPRVAYTDADATAVTAVTAVADCAPYRTHPSRILYADADATAVMAVTTAPQESQQRQMTHSATHTHDDGAGGRGVGGEVGSRLLGGVGGSVPGNMHALPQKEKIWPQGDKVGRGAVGVGEYQRPQTSLFLREEFSAGRASEPSTARESCIDEVCVCVHTCMRMHTSTSFIHAYIHTNMHIYACIDISRARAHTHTHTHDEAGRE